MAASVKVPLWKRLVILLSAVAAGVVVPFLLDQAGVTRWFAYAGGILAALVVLWVVAALLHVRLMRGWEQPR
jgi:hypothetical protein